MIDTLKMSETLIAAGIPEPHAKAIATTQAHAVGESAATKEDLLNVQLALETRIGKVESEMGTLKGMMGVVIALVLLVIGILLRK